MNGSILLKKEKKKKSLIEKLNYSALDDPARRACRMEIPDCRVMSLFFSFFLFLCTVHYQLWNNRSESCTLERSSFRDPCDIVPGGRMVMEREKEKKKEGINIRLIVEKNSAIRKAKKGKKKSPREKKKKIKKSHEGATSFES